MLYTITAFAPLSAAFFSLSEKYTTSPSVSLPRSTSKIESLTSRFSRSFSLPYPPNTIFPVIGLSKAFVPTIGKTENCLFAASNVATILEVTLLYDAPTVIEFGFLPGLPMVPKPGPLLPAAVTTTIP